MIDEIAEKYSALENIENNELSVELQELYLENKQWMSDLLFLEDETCIYEKLFDKVNAMVVSNPRVEEINPIAQHFIVLKEKRQALKDLINKNQKLLESLLEDQSKTIGKELIEENAEITENIRILFVEEKLLAKTLYRLTEKVFDTENKSTLLMK